MHSRLSYRLRVDRRQRYHSVRGSSFTRGQKTLYTFTNVNVYVWTGPRPLLHPQLLDTMPHFPPEIKIYNYWCHSFFVFLMSFSELRLSLNLLQLVNSSDQRSIYFLVKVLRGLHTTNKCWPTRVGKTQVAACERWNDIFANCWRQIQRASILATERFCLLVNSRLMCERVVHF